MKLFRWRNVLIYGSGPSRFEKITASLILLALYAVCLVWGV